VLTLSRTAWWTAVLAAGAVSVLLAGCSSQSAATPSGTAGAASSQSAAGTSSPTASSGSSAAGPATASATGSAGASAAGATTSPAAPQPSPTFAACALVGRSAAASALGTDVQAGAADVRGATAGLVQTDGCVYAGEAGRRVSYLAWSLVQAPGKAVVRRGLPPAAVGAKPFDPKLGEVSAGAVLGRGPTAVAQVNVAVRGRLVQVTVTGPDAAEARAAAVAAARTAVAAG
jgi:hypothetical protein